eukprot:403349794
MKIKNLKISIAVEDIHYHDAFDSLFSSDDDLDEDDDLDQFSDYLDDDSDIRITNRVSDPIYMANFNKLNFQHLKSLELSDNLIYPFPLEFGNLETLIIDDKVDVFYLEYLIDQVQETNEKYHTVGIPAFNSLKKFKGTFWIQKRNFHTDCLFKFIPLVFESITKASTVNLKFWMSRFVQVR